MLRVHVGMLAGELRRADSQLSGALAEVAELRRWCALAEEQPGDARAAGARAIAPSPPQLCSPFDRSLQPI